MHVLWIILFAILAFMLIGVESMVPRRTTLSAFELDRRRAQGNESAAGELRREVLLKDVLALKHALISLLLILATLVALVAFDFFVGTIAALIVALLYCHLAALGPIHTGAMKFYEQHEDKLLDYIDHHPAVVKLLQHDTVIDNPTEVSSREELEHLVDESGVVLTNEEKKRIISSLHFNETTVEQVMTPRSVIDTVYTEDLVGPLMLDELHKTGHSRFPVIDGDIDHVVGVLYIKELLTLNDKKSETAAEAMDAHVFYINEDQTLDKALAAFIKTHHHLFVVVNGYRETAGILTLEDVMEALLGQEIVDEYDVHDDLRIVAERNAKSNNNPPHATNV